jgi:hypothetical protein
LNCDCDGWDECCREDTTNLYVKITLCKRLLAHWPVSPLSFHGLRVNPGPIRKI